MTLLHRTPVRPAPHPGAGGREPGDASPNGAPSPGTRSTGDDPHGPANGGLSVSLLGDDGVRYYGSHLSKIQPGIRAGVQVEAGQRLGNVGRTGNANNVCHLHFGISPPCARTGDWKVRRGVIWPATYLTAWRNKTNKSPAAKVATWKRANNCKA